MPSFTFNFQPYDKSDTSKGNVLVMTEHDSTHDDKLWPTSLSSDLIRMRHDGTGIAPKSQLWTKSVTELAQNAQDAAIHVIRTGFMGDGSKTGICLLTQQGYDVAIDVQTVDKLPEYPVSYCIDWENSQLVITNTCVGKRFEVKHILNGSSGKRDAIVNPSAKESLANIVRSTKVFNKDDVEQWNATSTDAVEATLYETKVTVSFFQPRQDPETGAEIDVRETDVYLPTFDLLQSNGDNHRKIWNDAVTSQDICVRVMTSTTTWLTQEEGNVQIIFYVNGLYVGQQLMDVKTYPDSHTLLEKALPNRIAFDFHTQVPLFRIQRIAFFHHQSYTDCSIRWQVIVFARISFLMRISCG